MKKGLIMVNRCVLCECASENHHHLFFECPYSHDLLMQVEAWLGLRRLPIHLISLFKWMQRKKHKRHWKNKWLRSTIVALIYHLWTERNKRLFSGNCRTSDHVFYILKEAICIRLDSIIPATFRNYVV